MYMLCDISEIYQTWLEIFHTSPFTALILLAALVAVIFFILVVITTRNPGAPK